MAVTPIQIAVAITGSPTTLYTAFSVGGTRAMLIDLDFCNTSSADITIDVYYLKNADSTKKYLAKTLTVPALGIASWRGMNTLQTSLDSWVAVGSTTGVDCNGTVMEQS